MILSGQNIVENLRGEYLPTLFGMGTRLVGSNCQARVQPENTLLSNTAQITAIRLSFCHNANGIERTPNLVF